MQDRCLLEPLLSPFTATALDGRVIAWVTHKMVPVTLIASSNNLEQISFLAIPDPDGTGLPLITPP